MAAAPTERQPERLAIVSHSSVWRFERRLLRLGTWRLPVPYGVRLISVGYSVLALVAVLVLTRLPLVGLALAKIPLPVLYVILPCAAGWGLSHLKPDGRPAHRMLLGWLRHLVGPHWIAGWRPVARPGCRERIEDLTVVPDAAGDSLPRAQIAHPLPAPRRARRRGGRSPRRRERRLAITLRYPADVWADGDVVHVRQSSRVLLNRGTRIELSPGQRAVLEGQEPR